jgi:hypothetical protein
VDMEASISLPQRRLLIMLYCPQARDAMGANQNSLDDKIIFNPGILTNIRTLTEKQYDIWQGRDAMGKSVIAHAQPLFNNHRYGSSGDFTDLGSVWF